MSVEKTYRCDGCGAAFSDYPELFHKQKGALHFKISNPNNESSETESIYCAYCILDDLKSWMDVEN